MLTLQSVVVRPDRIIAVVRVDADASSRTTPELMEHVLRDFPDLARHACVNAKGPLFADVMNNTSIPHLLEHLVIDLQASEFTRQAKAQPALAREVPLLKGATRWTDEGQHVAQVQVSMFDDLVALRSLTSAVDYLNSLTF